MEQSFKVTGTLPGLNEIIAEAKKKYQAYNTMKVKYGTLVAACIRLAKLRPITGPVSVSLVWMEPSRRRDLDNVRVATKFIFDALVDTKILQNDGRKHIVAIADRHEIVEPQRAGVYVTLTEA